MLACVLLLLLLRAARLLLLLLLACWRCAWSFAKKSCVLDAYLTRLRVHRRLPRLGGLGRAWLLHHLVSDDGGLVVDDALGAGGYQVRAYRCGITPAAASPKERVHNRLTRYIAQGL